MLIYKIITFESEAILNVSPEPIKVLLFNVRESCSQILLLPWSKLKIGEKFIDCSNPTKHNILASKRILPKKNLKCGLLLMLITDKIGIRARKLIQITGKKIGVMDLI